MSKESPQYVVCHECDLLLEEIPLIPGGVAICCCCGASLYRNTPYSIQRTLALVLTALILFIIANIYPILGIEIQGNRSATNLFGAIHALWIQDMHLISTLVFCTTVLVPTIELSAMIYILLPISRGIVPPGIAPVMRLMNIIKPWGMVEIFMLGVLVSLVKLKNDSSIIPGIALWSFGGLTLLFAAIAASFNPRDVWEQLDDDDAASEDSA